METEKDEIKKENGLKLQQTLNVLLGDGADVSVTYEPKSFLSKTSPSQTDLPYVDLDSNPALVISGNRKNLASISSLLAKGDITHSIIPDPEYKGEEVISIDTRKQPDLTGKIARLEKIAEEMKAGNRVGKVDSSITLLAQKQNDGVPIDI